MNECIGVIQFESNLISHVLTESPENLDPRTRGLGQLSY